MRLHSSPACYNIRVSAAWDYTCQRPLQRSEWQKVGSNSGPTAPEARTLPLLHASLRHCLIWSFDMSCSLTRIFPFEAFASFAFSSLLFGQLMTRIQWVDILEQVQLVSKNHADYYLIWAKLRENAFTFELFEAQYPLQSTKYCF